MPSAYYMVSSGTQKLTSSTSYGYYVVSTGKLIISSGGTTPLVLVGDNGLGSGGYVEVLSRGSISSCSLDNGGSLVVSEGGNVWNIYFQNGYGTLKMGAYCHSGRVFEGGELTAFGANVYSVNVDSGGSFYLYTESSGGEVSSGSATGTRVWSGGTVYFGSRTYAESVHISAGGFVHIHGLAQSNFVNGTFVVSSAGTANENYVGSGGNMYVYGKANSSYISSGGVMRISSGGSTFATNVRTGGNMYIANGGIASATKVSAGGTAYVYSGGKALGGDFFGGTAYIYSGGSASDITMSSGIMYISSGGTASGTVMYGGDIRLDGDSSKGVYKGGKVIINNGGYSLNEVFSAGEFYVFGSGSASGIVYNGTIGSGGTMNISGGQFGGSIVSNAVINVTTGTADLKSMKGAVANIKGGILYASASSGGSMTSATLDGYGSRTGKMFVYSGATVNAVNVNANGQLTIMNGGSVTSASAGVSSGSYSASIGVSSGGKLGSARVYGGKLDVESGGSVSSAIFMGGGNGVVRGTVSIADAENSGFLQVMSGGTVTTVHADSGGSVYISGGGYVSRAFVTSKGKLNVNGGFMGDAYVASGGTMTVNSGGSVGKGDIVGGSAVVSYGGKASGLNVCLDGRLTVSGYGAVNGLTASDGAIEVLSGGTLTNGMVSSGGSVTLFDNAIALYCAISSGGVMIISSGAAYNNFEVRSGGKVTGNYNCYGIAFSSGGIADINIFNTGAGNTNAVVNLLSYAMNKGAVFTLTVGTSQKKGTYKLADNASGFDETITVQNIYGDALGTLKVGQTASVGGVNYKLDLDSDSVLSVTVGAVAPAGSAKSDIDGNGISDVMFVWTGNNYAHGYWMNGTNTWQSANSNHPAEWENLGCHDMTGNGKADSVLFGNVTSEAGVKGAYIGYYADANDLPDGSTWVNIGYLTNENNIQWKNTVGNLTGSEAGVNSIVWYAPELYALGVWKNGKEDWATLSGDFGGNAWTLVGCGDFDGDGKDSVVMSYNGGQLFYTVGINGASTALGSTNWSGWEVRAIGDFAGDQKDDLVLFHKASGSMVMCANGNLDSYVSIGQLDTNDWFVVGAGDYNGDQKDDLLVRQYSTGMLGYYSAGDTAQWVELGRGVDMNWTVIA